MGGRRVEVGGRRGGGKGLGSWRESLKAGEIVCKRRWGGVGREVSEVRVLVTGKRARLTTISPVVRELESQEAARSAVMLTCNRSPVGSGHWGAYSRNSDIIIVL